MKQNKFCTQKQNIQSKYNLLFKFVSIMIDEEVLYGGLGTQTELKKRMTGKAIAKSHDLNG